MKSPEQAMLDAIARDIDQHPDVLRPVDAKLAGRCRALSAGFDVDLDVPL
ncbi:transcriptional regulator [Tibeticola sp.]|nr:transcriptional regulator [Tibeticola sp.]MCI4440237.1 transcriptional regulator [Tibeticola sp.]